MPVIQIRAVRSKGRHFEIESVLDHDNYTEVRPDSVSVWENLLHDVRRCIGRDVEIFCRQSLDHVADTTAREIGDVATRTQTPRDFARTSLHRRYFH